MDAANSSIHKYFVDDLSDLIDCMDFGFHQSLTRAFKMQSSAIEQVLSTNVCHCLTVSPSPGQEIISAGDRWDEQGAELIGFQVTHFRADPVVGIFFQAGQEEIPRDE